METHSEAFRHPAEALFQTAEVPVATTEFDQYQSRTYLPELDGIRALSVLMVIACHMGDKHVWENLGGHQGVTIFFILSGFLITMLGLREERRHGAVSLSAFYVRRAFRILPMYYLALAMLFVLIHFLGWGQPLRTTFDNALPSYLCYYQDIQFARDLAVNTVSPFAHSWSLGIEEKFYLVWPLLAFVIWRGQFRSRVAMAMVLAFLFASTKSAWRISPRVESWQLGRILSPYFDILAGSVLALLLNERGWFERLRFLTRPAWAGAILATFICVHGLAARVGPSLVEIQILYTIAFALLLAAIVRRRGWMQRLLQIDILVFVGQLSYGMYLFHGLGISAAQKLVRPGSGRLEVSLLAYVAACAFTVGASYLLAILFERPLIRVGKRLLARWSLSAAQTQDPQTKRGSIPVSASV